MILNHWVLRSLGRGSSQSSLCCHSSCKTTLADIVMGETNPRGSKSLDTSLRTSRFVVKECCIDVGFLGLSVKVSETVFHSKPKTFTVVGLQHPIHYNLQVFN